MHRAPAAELVIDDSVVRALATPAAFEHPAGTIERIETHISWLILAGDYAYKIKKPIVLPFLDFSTLEKRKHFCDEELRLNRYWAPELYIDVIPVTMRGGVTRFGGDGDIIDYAVRMRRFEQAMQLDRQLHSGDLAAEDIIDLANYVAARHAEAYGVDPGDRERVLAETRSLMMENFDVLEGRLDDERLKEVERWTRQSLESTTDLIARRFDDGYVRNCHGDLHLANVVRLDQGLRAFDCIEFSADLRHIDVICDIAFLIMDLQANNEHRLAAIFLNRYLEVTGDYEGVALLELFVVYRSLVRAKVAVIRADERSSKAERRSDLDEARHYLDLAVSKANRSRPGLILMHGLSGSGKTHVSTQLLATLPAVRIRSDLERKRQAGLGAFDSSESPPGEGLYDAGSGKRTYDRLRSLAATILRAGHNVIVDAAFLALDERRAAADLAERLNIPVVIVDVRAPDEVLRQRIVERATRRDAASEADIAVLEYQLATESPLTAAELGDVIVCDNTLPSAAESLVSKIRNAIGSR